MMIPKILKWARKLPFDQRGSIAVILACLITAAVGFSALVLDAGMVYLNRHRMVNAVDAAALAGALELPFGGEARARQMAQDYAAKNLKGDYYLNIDVKTQSGQRTIEVSAERMSNLFFARAFGHKQARVRAAATAAGESLLLPFGIFDITEEAGGYVYEIKPGDEITIQNDVNVPLLYGPQGNKKQGNFGALSFSGETGYSALERAILYGVYNQQDLEFWDSIQTEPGVMAKVVEAINTRLDMDKDIGYIMGFKKIKLTGRTYIPSDNIILLIKVKLDRESSSEVQVTGVIEEVTELNNNLQLLKVTQSNLIK